MMRSTRIVPLSSTLLYGLTWLLALALPFEVIRPLLSFQPWFEFTNLELLLLATAVAWALHVALTRHWSPRSYVQSPKSPGPRTQAPDLGFRISDFLDTPLIRPALLFLALALLSALLAPTHRVEALKFVTRFAWGVYAFFLVVSVATTRTRATGLIWALILGAGLSALLGLGEAVGWRVLDPLLALFKVAPTRVGGMLRVSATFQYATIASMFFEMAVPLALVAAATSRTRRLRWLALAIALVCTLAVVLTLTRSGMLTLALLFTLMGGLTRTRRGFRPLGVPVALAASTLLISIGILALRAPAFRIRLTTESDVTWYGASYTVPASLTLRAGEAVTVTVTVRNTGRATWTAGGEHPFALGYRWLTADGRRAFRLPQTAVPLPRDVAPGETVRLETAVQAPLPPGAYRLAWDMLQQGILRFRDRGVPEAETRVRIEPGPSAPATPLPPTEPRRERAALPPTVRRLPLWRAALRMWVERPLLGMGPDNFRHLYGRYLGLSEWDERVHANNLYLELLADLGLLGAAAFAWLLLAALRQLVRVLRTPPDGSVALWTAGLGGALLAFLLHGLFDYFLGFVSLYLLFWMVLGTLVALRATTDPT